MVIVSPVIYYELHGIVRFGPASATSMAAICSGSSCLRTSSDSTTRHRSPRLPERPAYSGSDAETVSYVGLPLALIVARYTITRWRLTLTRVLFVILAIVVVLMLGSYLHIAGYPTIPLPWNLLDRGLLADVIPLRLTIYMFLIIAVILAMWLAQPRTGIWGWANGRWPPRASRSWSPTSVPAFGPGGHITPRSSPPTNTEVSSSVEKTS